MSKKIIELCLIPILLVVVIAAAGMVHSSTASSCVSATDGWSSMQEKTIYLSDDHGDTILLPVRVADEPAELAAGYQYICPEVVRQTAILFDFGRPFTSRFHMKNVFAPLDIAFFDPSGRLVKVVHMSAEPPGFSGKRKFYSAGAPYQYALETPGGYLADKLLSSNHLRLDPKSVH